MAEALSLNVLLADAEVGHLHVDARQQLSFAYSPEWRARGIPLSPSLPLTPSGEWQNAASAFFQNLLPEGQALDDAARVLQISKASTFGLLRAMGGEASGAVRILSADYPVDAERRRLIPRQELSARIRDRQDVAFSVWDGTVRLSIAGYQDKLAVFETDDQWFMVDGAQRASTHILKPDPIAPRLVGLTSNEFVCMRLAAAVQLSVAPVRLKFVPEPVLVVQRFDRVRGADESVQRLHVIDACQALGVPPSLKYERPYGDGRDVAAVRVGATLPQLFGLGRWAATPAVFKLHLLRWVIFQTLIQNFDAHAKNISFFWSQQGLQLAPAYDLVSIGAYPAGWFPHTFAMALGDAFTVRDLTAFEWAHFASLCDLRPRQLAAELLKMCTAIERQAEAVSKAVIAEGADAATVQRVLELAVATSQSQGRAALEIPKIHAGYFN